MTLRNWDRQEMFVETIGRLRRKRVADLTRRIRQIRKMPFNRPRSAKTEEASARIARRLMVPQ
jgi:hypothetical protein